MIKILLPHVRHWRLIRPESERALPLEVVGDEIRLSGNEIRISFYGSDYDRLVKDLLKDTDGESRYLAGSMYMIGKVRDHLGLPIKPLWHRVEK
jgi:folylpolyglutamate synthase/dihydropteroate synthase